MYATSSKDRTLLTIPPRSSTTSVNLWLTLSCSSAVRLLPRQGVSVCAAVVLYSISVGGWDPSLITVSPRRRVNIDDSISLAEACEISAVEINFSYHHYSITPSKLHVGL